MKFQNLIAAKLNGFTVITLCDKQAIILYTCSIQLK